jgi:tRNA pseudouridine13 synthase
MSSTPPTPTSTPTTDAAAPTSSSQPAQPALPSFLTAPLPPPPPRAYPTTLPFVDAFVGGTIEFRGDDDDFLVDEVPSYLPSGEGEHLYLQIEKRGLSTPALLRRLRDLCRLDERDIGIAGHKDARGVTRQWVSVPARVVEPRLAELPEALGATIVQSGRHGNKLRMGHNRGNRFTCRLHGTSAADAVVIAARAAELAARGLPNFFGQQRFGHGDRTLREAERFLVRPRKAVSRREKMWASAVQSAIFNTWLALRVSEGTWNQALDGDMLEKITGASFVSDDPATDGPRVAAGEVSPSGPMYGRAMRCAERDALTRESRSLAEMGVNVEMMIAHPAFNTGTRRCGRVWPTEVEVRPEPTSTVVSFALGSGSYASVFLHELIGPRLADRFFTPAEGDAGGGD